MPNDLKRATLKPDPFRAAHIAGAADDIRQLSHALNSRGIAADDLTIYETWCRYSNDYCASWLSLYPDDESNASALLRHLNLHPA